MTNVVAFDELQAFFEASESVVALMGSPAVGDRWGQSSLVEGFTVGGLCGHLVRIAARLEDLLIDRPPCQGHVVPIAHFYNAPTAPGHALDDPVGRFVVEDGEGRALAGQDVVVGSFRRLLDNLRVDLENMQPTALVGAARAPNCAAHLQDVLATRVVEIVIHGDDVASSVDVSWEAPPTAVRVALHALLEVARGRSGDLAVLRAVARGERADAGIFPVI